MDQSVTSSRARTHTHTHTNTPSRKAQRVTTRTEAKSRAWQPTWLGWGTTLRSSLRPGLGSTTVLAGWPGEAGGRGRLGTDEKGSEPNVARSSAWLGVVGRARSGTARRRRVDGVASLATPQTVAPPAIGRPAFQLQGSEAASEACPLRNKLAWAGEAA